MPLAFLFAALAAQSPEANQTAALPKPQLICRGGERIVGTHMRTGRRCLTAVEWQQQDAKVQGPVPTLQVTSDQNDGHAPPQRPQ